MHFKRQERIGNAEHIEKIDRWVIWLYPFCFIVPPLTLYMTAR